MLENPRKAINAAISLFLIRDRYLLSVNDEDDKAHEIAIAHRIAVYLEDILRDLNLNVDLDYNKHGEKPKMMNGGLVRPDITVHLRGNDRRNFIVIEIKKDTHSLDAKDEAIKRVQDFCMRKSDGGKFGYQYGYVIEARKDNLEVIYPRDGEAFPTHGVL